MSRSKFFATGILVALVFQACNLPSNTPTEEPVSETEAPSEEVFQTEAPPIVQHEIVPVSVSDVKPYPDVTSRDTAPEQRAPYGDSYDINRLERPFTAEMTYLPDIDIASFSISAEGDFYYVSIELVGTNPNSSATHKYYLELDTNLDSYGDFLIVAEGPFSTEWTAENIRIYSDTNRDSAGLTASKSDAPFSGNGYDTVIHDIAAGIGDDVDAAWICVNASDLATVQFAVKKTLAGDKFLYLVMADAGLQDVARLDYVDYFTEEQAGSPVRSSRYYPLKELYAVDNTCYQAFGFVPTGYEPKICPEILQPQIIESGGYSPSTPGSPSEDYCTSIGRPNPGNCPYGWSDAPYCVCTPG